jgi:D-psicose/D-tagatose/L-ribulose 3-epimerase
MQYGLNLLLWTDRMHDGLVPVVERIKSLGYDGIEMPIFELDEPVYRQWGRKLDAIGLKRTAVTVRGPGDNPISPSAGVRAAAVDAMRRTPARGRPTTSSSGGPRRCGRWPTTPRRRA